ncbi:hypothetical protein CC86DRAFT_407818 [Ophiobolus disseminans]|uniref:Secretory phospholipase A2 n=1 Tax=Ophiobolus disseminans TaxID=1469910 RepID=A0A6A6ZWF3_9PLEO|nr:hypothetical protein CC86DRAFT_407818 [Ophiobolus disseminans]
MKSTIIAILAFASLAFSAPLSLGDCETALKTTTDSYVFSISIDQFIANRKGHPWPALLDWSADGCSTSPDNPFGFDFINSCYRHDFGYRNFKQQNRFSDANKERIDSNFKKDLFNQCKSETSRTACDKIATIYYNGVVLFGKKRAAEILEARMAADEE